MGMGGVSAGGGGGGRRRRGRKRAVMSEINITPMVDVMLVLLIIFMVAAPMMTAVPIDLPSSAAAAMPNQADPITVGVTPEGAVFIDETPVAEADLVAQLNALGVNGAEDRIFLRGDTSANYGAVMRVMGLLSAGGFSKIGLITQPEE